MSRRHQWWTLAALIGVGAVLRVYRFDALGLWLDEGITAHVARLPWPTVLGLHGPYEAHPPLYFIATKLMTLMVPELQAGRVVSLISGILTIPALYFLAGRLLGTRPALVACAVLAVSPIHVWYSREGRMYALSGLLITLAYLALVAFYETPRRRTAVLYGATIAAAMYVNYGALYSLAPQAILLIMLARKHGRQSLPIWGAIVVAGLVYLPWVPSLLNTTSSLGMMRDYYLGVTPAKIAASVASIIGVGGQGSYFWGTKPTPWEHWPSLQPVFIFAMCLALLGAAVSLAKRPLSAAVVIGLLPGTVAVGALVSLVSPGYADRTVMAAVLGWSIALGSLTADRLPARIRSAGWLGAVIIVSTCALTFRAIYVGGDKQHWRQLASDAKFVSGFGFPVWAYPTYSATLVDLYEPSVFALRGPHDHPNLVIADDADAPASTTDALWLAYTESQGLDRVQKQLEERGYQRAMHRYYWNPIYLDLYLKPGVRVGREIPIQWRGADGTAEREWRLPGGRGAVLTGSGQARAGQLYLLGLEARLISRDGSLNATFRCVAGARDLETATSEQAASLRADGEWQRLSAATTCSGGADHVVVEISNTGASELLVRGMTLYEVQR